MTDGNKVLIALIILVLFLLTLNPASADQVQYDLKAGWNKVSFPFEAVTDLGDTSNINNILCHYNPETHLYEFVTVSNPSAINTCYGYWVKADADTTLTVAGTITPTDPVHFNVKTGWNQFGIAHNCSKIWGDVQVTYLGSDYTVNDAVTQNWFTGTIFYYNTETASYDFYFVSSWIECKKAFWLQSTIDSVLTFTYPDVGRVEGVVTDTETDTPLADVTMIYRF